MRSLNKVQLIGNLTRDPELTQIKDGTSVCNFSVATDRSWKTESGEQKEESEFHRVIAWHKLAEICGSMLLKGTKVFIEGRLQTRKYTGQDGIERTSTEVVANDMIILSPKPADKPPVEKPIEKPTEETPEVASDLPF